MSRTDRRAFIAGFPTAAIAAQWSDRLATADPTPRELRALELDVRQIAGIYFSTPLEVVVPRAEQGWLAVHEILERPVGDSTRTRLRRVAGRYSFYLAQAAGDAGNEPAAANYLALASQHAAASGDDLVAGSVAVLDSTTAYFAGDNATSADVAAEAFETTTVHPFVVGMLSACRARAAARCKGREDEARRALDLMQDSIWTGEVLPGCRVNDVGNVEAQTAVVLGSLGHGEQAETHARVALTEAIAAGRVREAGGINNALARSLLARRDPEPEEAARVVLVALETVREQPVHWVTARAGLLHGELERRWPAVAAVRELGDAMADARRSLPPGRLV